MAAGDEEDLAGDPARILGGKKDCDGTDVVGLTDPAQRRLRFHGFLPPSPRLWRDKEGKMAPCGRRQIPTVIDRRYKKDCKDRFGVAPKVRAGRA